MGDYFSAQQGRLWVQTGPGASPQYLGCHATGDLTIPQGGITNRFCPSPTKRGAYKLVAQTQDPPDQITFSVEGRIGKEATYLERYSDCPLTFYVLQSDCDDPRDFSAFERVVVIEDCRKTSESETNLTARDSDDEALQSFEFNPANVARIYPLTSARQTCASVLDAMDVAFGNVRQCSSACGDAMSECQVGILVTAAAAGTADAYITLNGGATWTVTGAAPFAVTMDNSCATVFPTGRGTYRFIVGRGTTDAGPADIAYTDDNGATWTGVALTTGNGDFFPFGNCLWSLDRYHIWAVTDDGDIHFSGDGGLTWTEQASGNAASLNAIFMLDEAYGIFGGDGNVIYTTGNGGNTWSALTGPAAQAGVDVISVSMTDQHTLYVGYADGTLWISTDSGTNWTNVGLSIGGAVINRVNDIQFVEGSRFTGWAAVKFTVGADVFGGIMRTFDGGNSWQYVSSVALDAGAIGMAGIWACAANKAVGVGDIATTATVYVASD